VDIKYDSPTKSFSFPVTIAIYEAELGLLHGHESEESIDKSRRQIIDLLISKGLRGQLKTASLVTGQLYIALEFIKDAPPQQADWNAHPRRLPTTPGTVHALEQSLNSILKKVEKMPLTEIGQDTRNTLSALNEATRNLNVFIKGLNQNIAPATQESLDEIKKLLVDVRKVLEPNSPLQRDLRKTLRETTRSVQTIRTLADTLEGEPESVLKGKKDGDDQ
jgi:paraquat-inducible protein B